MTRRYAAAVPDWWRQARRNVSRSSLPANQINDFRTNQPPPRRDGIDDADEGFFGLVLLEELIYSDTIGLATVNGFVYDWAVGSHTGTQSNAG